MPQFPYIKTIYENDELSDSTNSQSIQDSALPPVQPPQQQQEQQQQQQSQQLQTLQTQTLSSNANAIYSNNPQGIQHNTSYIGNVDQSQYQPMYNVQSYPSTDQTQYISYPPNLQKKSLMSSQMAGIVDNAQTTFRPPASFGTQNSNDYLNNTIPGFYHRNSYSSTVFYPPNQQHSSIAPPTSNYYEVHNLDSQGRMPSRSQTPAASKSTIMFSTPQRPNSTQNNIATRKIITSATSTPNYRAHGGIYKVSMIDAGTNRSIKLDYSKVSQLAYEISQNMIKPPLKNLKSSKTALIPDKPRRTKRRSKFTPEQDKLIVELKNENKSWVEIAEIAKVDSYLTARNRYQVLIGQQGGSSSDFTSEDLHELQQIVDDAEIEKMKHLSKEFRKCTGKLCTYKQVRELIRYLFWKDPSQFDVGTSYLLELNRLQKIRKDEFGYSDIGATKVSAAGLKKINDNTDDSKLEN